MKIQQFARRSLLLVSLAGLTTTGFAGSLTAEQIAQLGTTLTPTGAQMAGNAEGTIPAWTGGLPVDAAPVVDNFISNPYPDDKPLFVITAQNVQEHADKLTPGQLAMFARYPETFSMPIYQTRRSTAYPEYVNKHVKENAGRARLLNNGDGLTDFEFGYFAFPIPENGAEVLWNHKTRYRINFKRRYANAAPTAGGAYSLVQVEEASAYPQYVPDVDLESQKGIFAYVRNRTVAPARHAGNAILIHDTLDPVAMPRLAWTYNAGQRRVRRAPQLAYDSPDSTSDGMRTVDNFYLFTGAPDRYDWKLVGVKEIYVPYNSFKLAEKGLPYDDIIQPGHINPEHTRYELHRVWEVQGTLKDGVRHIYGQRNLFIDEDSWMVLLADHYDGRGNLWRVGEGHLVQQYHKQIPAYAVETIYDLQAGRYNVAGMTSQEASGPDYNYSASYSEFTPNALRATGIR